MAATLSSVLAGCAHAPAMKKVEPTELLRMACAPGRDVRAARGSAWLKVSSKEVSGQFPAMVEVAAGPREPSLAMEVTNLVGGREALIRVDGKRYTVDVPNKKDRSQSGTRTWGGIPLEWATELFLGRIPCPPADAFSDAVLRQGEKGELEVEIPGNLSREPQRFVYRFRTREGVVWPEALHWERKRPPALSVDFKFDDPEDGTGSPRKWEAKSAQGEVKVRWKDRELPR